MVCGTLQETLVAALPTPVYTGTALHALREQASDGAATAALIQPSHRHENVGLLRHLTTMCGAMQGMPLYHNTPEAKVLASSGGDGGTIDPGPLTGQQLREALASLQAYDWDYVRAPTRARAEAVEALATARVAPTGQGSDALVFDLQHFLPPP